MKKLLSLALIVMVCCSAAIMFGCSSKGGTIVINGTTTGLTKFTGDAVAYNDAIDSALAGINIVVTDTAGIELYKNTLKVAKTEGASIMGFSLRNEGTFTARVTMFGITQEFEYSVGATTPGNTETPGNQGNQGTE